MSKISRDEVAHLAGLARLAVTEAERELRKLIEQAWYNADASYAKYPSPASPGWRSPRRSSTPSPVSST